MLEAVAWWEPRGLKSFTTDRDTVRLEMRLGWFVTTTRNERHVLVYAFSHLSADSLVPWYDVK